MNRPLQPANPPSAAEPGGTGANSGSHPVGSAPSRDPDADLETLKRLLFTPEQERISDLQRRLDDPEIRAQESARVLAEAVRRAAAGDPELAVALRPLVEAGLQESIHRNPEAIVDTIYPILGPAIRKAVASAVRGMLESLNRVAEHSFTWHGLQWRMEAWRTGQTVAEVALKHSVIYRVEQVLLIHRESGLLLLAVGADPAARDQDLVSGMLTAIQDFVHDSFSVERDQDLDRVEVGDFQVWIERGPRAALAAVIRGSAPRRLRANLSDAVAAVHRGMRARLEKFDGDASPFEAVRPVLEDCLEQEFRDKRSGPSPAFLAVCGVLVALLAVWGFFLWRDAQRWSRLVQAVDAEPGLALLERMNGSASILRDPLARDPTTLASEAGFGEGEPDIEVRPFLSLDAPIFERRARQLLAAPDSVRLAYDNGVLTVSGEAEAAWVSGLRARAAGLPGVDRLETDGLAAGNRRALEAAIGEAGAIQISFPTGVTAIPEAQLAKLDEIAKRTRRALELAEAGGVRVEVSIVGRADEVGPRAGNVRLSELRAAELQAALQERGLPAERYPTRGELVEPGGDRTAGVEIRLQEDAP